MRIKKFLTVGISALVAVSMAFSLAACTTTSDTSTSSGTTSTGTTDSSATSDSTATTTTETITVWCPQAAVELTTSQLNALVAEYPSCPYTFVIEAVGEGEAATNLITDVTAGADIYFFAQDQLSRLVSAGALSEVSSTFVDDVSDRNDGGSVSAATVNNVMYAYPLTSDNGYFMYYDTSVLTEEDITNQTTIIEKCEAAGKQIGFQLTNSGWYAAAYFFATGCVSEWTSDDSGTFTGYNDTFNSANGIIAVKGMAELIASSAFVGSDAADASLFNSGAAVVVSGTWDYDTAVEALGDNLGCAKLWSFTVDDTDYQLGSFSGNKLLGVKPQTDATKAAWCHIIANYLTGEACQQERFDSLSWGPSNTTVQAGEEVQANPALAALAAQSEYATPQGQFPNAWWDASKAIGVNIQAAGAATLTDEQAQEVLDIYTEALNTIMSATTELVVVGSMSGWTTSPEGDYYLNYDNNTYASKTESSPLLGTWTVTLTLSAGDMFRVTDSGWNTYAGYSVLTSDSDSDLTGNDDDNIVVAVDGTYTVVVDSTSGSWTIKVTRNA